MSHDFANISILELDTSPTFQHQGARGSAIDRIDPASLPADKEWAELPLPQLVRHIVTVGHDGLRAAMPRLRLLAQDVAELHGSTHPHLLEVACILRRIDAALQPHLQVEENVLFPLIVALDLGLLPPDAPVDVSIDVVTNEHENERHHFALLRDLTDGYYLPDGACDAFRTLYEALAHLEARSRSNAREEKFLFRRALACVGQLQRAKGDLVSNNTQTS